MSHYRNRVVSSSYPVISYRKSGRTFGSELVTNCIDEAFLAISLVVGSFRIMVNALRSTRSMSDVTLMTGQRFAI